MRMGTTRGYVTTKMKEEKKKKREEDLRPWKLETNTEDKQIKFLG